jgi:uncharacterized protein Yka (UPF0111/DUF47 family)
MTPTLGLERLPRPIATLLAESVANLLTIANQFDAFVHGDPSALDAIARCEEAGDRIVHDFIGVASHSRRVGPDRARLILLAQAVDDVVDALDTLARALPRPPLPEFTDVLLALRDAARDIAHAVAAIERDDELRTWLAHSREREQEVRHLGRAARAWLLVEQTDPELAIRGHNALRHAEAALRACARLRVRLDSQAPA